MDAIWALLMICTLQFTLMHFSLLAAIFFFGSSCQCPKSWKIGGTLCCMGGGKSLFFNILYRIVIPSIIFSAIEFFPSCIIQGRDIDVEFALYKTIGGGTYWFTSALVIAELILLLFLCSRKENLWFYVVSGLSIGLLGLLIVRFEIFNNGIWAWRQGFISLIFLVLGGVYWRYEKPIDNHMNLFTLVPLLLLYIVLVLGFKETNNPLISTLKIQPLGFVTSIIACLLLVWLCKKMPELDILTYVGQNSLGFYFLCGALPITLSKLANVMFSDTIGWMVFLIWFLSLLLACFAVLIINRRARWLWDLRVLKVCNNSN